MGNGELDRLDPGKIGIVHQMLPPGPCLGLLAKHIFKRRRNSIERGDRWQAQRAATVFQPRAGLMVDQGKQHQARIGRDICENPVEMLLRAHHRPEMADNIGIVELRQRCLGDHLQRFAG